MPTATKSAPEIRSHQVHEAEIVQPSWERARYLLERTKLAIRLSLAGQVLLGMELQELKKHHGFLGSGRRPNKTSTLHSLPAGEEETLNRTWDDWCKSELGISRFTADRMISTYEAAKARLRKLGGEPKLLSIIETPPAQLGDEERNLLEAAVAKVTDGASQKDLLEELKLVKTHVSLTGGDTSEHRGKTEPPADEQLAFHFWEGPVLGLFRCRSDKSYLHTLHLLPLAPTEESPVSLTTMEAELEGLLNDIREAKAARLKSSNLTPVPAA